MTRTSSESNQHNRGRSSFRSGSAIVIWLVARALAAGASLLWPGVGLAIDALSAPVIRSAGSGPWSAAATWKGGRAPDAGTKVQIRAGHQVVYDAKSLDVIRSLHIAGTLTFAQDRDTELNVGLIKIQSGDDLSEEGFDCDVHIEE